jgi:hypothetical protein
MIGQLSRPGIHEQRKHQTSIFFTHACPYNARRPKTSVRKVRRERERRAGDIRDEPSQLARKTDSAAMTGYVVAFRNIVCVQRFLLRAKDACTKRLDGCSPVQTLKAENECRKRDDISYENAALKRAVSGSRFWSERGHIRGCGCVQELSRWLPLVRDEEPLTSCEHPMAPISTHVQVNPGVSYVPLTPSEGHHGGESRQTKHRDQK